MQYQTLNKLISENLFQIPDYQRGYAWEQKQWNEFVQDIDALSDDEVQSHYTGTVVVYGDKRRELKPYGKARKLSVLDVVDGQQRLTTCSLYLSIVIHSLLRLGEEEYRPELTNFLYAGSTSKLQLNNDCQGVYLDLLEQGQSRTTPITTHQKRLVETYVYLKSHVDTQVARREQAQAGKGKNYLQQLFIAITQKLSFTFYSIEDECEIGMTFELMNSRGKDLSILELLKNYFMHWISRNSGDEIQRTDITSRINKDWKVVYNNLGTCDGNEDQCLRVAWTLYCSHSQDKWKGYAGFKDVEYIPLRDFGKRNKQAVQDFLLTFSSGLSNVSLHYARVITPTVESSLHKEEYIWLKKLQNAGNVATFLPLIIAARIKVSDEKMSVESYLELLRALECYLYRVFIFGGRRSNAGISNLYAWGSNLFHEKMTPKEITESVYQMALFYSPEAGFVEWISKPRDWYSYRRFIKYTLFEYELYLLEREGKGKTPFLKWEDLNDTTIEHILPQNPEKNSHWNQAWTIEKQKTYIHDIGNLVLTQNNSNYRNFEFQVKKGQAGKSPSYANSDIRQERRVAVYDDWTSSELNTRRGEIISWIKERWGIEGKLDTLVTEFEINEQIDD